MRDTMHHADMTYRNSLGAYAGQTTKWQRHSEHKEFLYNLGSALWHIFHRKCHNYSVSNV